MGDRLRTGKPAQYHPGQLSLLPYAGREMSTAGQSAVMLCGWGVKSGWLIPSVDKRIHGWQVKLLSLVNTWQRERFKYCTHCTNVLLVHGQVTIIFVVSVCLSVCLFVCLFVCAEFFSAVFDPIWIKHVTCPGLVVSPRI